MIKTHPRLKTINKNLLINIQLKQFDLHGDVYRPVIDMLYDVFSWYYVEGRNIVPDIENKVIKEVLSKYFLDFYIGDSISYSAVLLYADLSRKYNMRDLGAGKKTPVTEASNKLFKKSHFLFEDLYKMYNNSAGDLSEDFILFNELFEVNSEKEVTNIKAFGEVLKTNSKVDLVKPDFSYKLITKQLQVNRVKEECGNSEKLIYVLQDCTESTRRFENQINMVKGFILNEAFKHDYVVEWLFVESKVIDSQRLSKETIKQEEIKNVVFGSKVDITNILTEDRFLNKQVIILTDGTDPFNFKFNTKTKKINVISLTESTNIRNKIANYGRFFKIFQ